jgi:formate/nitrite transporter
MGRKITRFRALRLHYPQGTTGEAVMADNFSMDAYSPQQIAERVDSIGVAKARLPLLSMAMLGMLAGAFIGLGALYYTLVISDASLSFAVARVLGAVCFSLGLLLVVVAGAELFTGNNLLAMAWADGKVSTTEVLRNWAVVCVANFAGAAGLALLVFLSGHAGLNGGAVGQTYLKIAAAKSSLPLSELFFRGVLCNVLVCMAVWMVLAGRSVTDKFFAILLPISAFVAAGFEHSIANMYFFPMALLLKASGMALPPGADAVTLYAMFRNLGPVIAGNIVGGSVLVALVYYVIYIRPGKSGG